MNFEKYYGYDGEFKLIEMLEAHLDEWPRAGQIIENMIEAIDEDPVKLYEDLVSYVSPYGYTQYPALIEGFVVAVQQREVDAGKVVFDGVFAPREKPPLTVLDERYWVTGAETPEGVLNGLDERSGKLAASSESLPQPTDVHDDIWFRFVLSTRVPGLTE